MFNVFVYTLTLVDAVIISRHLSAFVYLCNKPAIVIIIITILGHFVKILFDSQTATRVLGSNMVESKIAWAYQKKLNHQVHVLCTKYTFFETKYTFFAMPLMKTEPFCIVEADIWKGKIKTGRFSSHAIKQYSCILSFVLSFAHLSNAYIFACKTPASFLMCL